MVENAGTVVPASQQLATYRSSVSISGESADGAPRYGHLIAHSCMMMIVFGAVHFAVHLYHRVYEYISTSLGRRGELDTVLIGRYGADADAGRGSSQMAPVSASGASPGHRPSLPIAPLALNHKLSPAAAESAKGPWRCPEPPWTVLTERGSGSGPSASLNNKAGDGPELKRFTARDIEPVSQ
ncbi:hypothetical protein V8C44DRAFT_361996 [Trichoderma aethiopicum]